MSNKIDDFLVLPPGYIYTYTSHSKCTLFHGLFIHSLNLRLQNSIYELEGNTTEYHTQLYDYYIPIMWSVCGQYLSQFRMKINSSSDVDEYDDIPDLIQKEKDSIPLIISF